MLRSFSWGPGKRVLRAAELRGADLRLHGRKTITSTVIIIVIIIIIMAMLAQGFPCSARGLICWGCQLSAVTCQL